MFLYFTGDYFLGRARIVIQSILSNIYYGDYVTQLELVTKYNKIASKFNYRKFPESIGICTDLTSAYMFYAAEQRKDEFFQMIQNITFDQVKEENEFNQMKPFFDNLLNQKKSEDNWPCSDSVAFAANNHLELIKNIQRLLDYLQQEQSNQFVYMNLSSHVFILEKTEKMIILFTMQITLVNQKN